MVRTFAAVVLAVCACAFICRAADSGIDLATIITRQDAQAALGEPVKEPQARSEEGADGYYSKCNYYSMRRGRSLVIRLQLPGPNAIAPDKELQLVGQANGSTESVSGVGDAAQMFTAGGEGPDKGPSHALMLYVVKANAFVTVAISGIDDEKAATEKAKALAKKILGKL